MKTSQYTGIIFDLDGTLADTLADLIDACNAMLAHFGYPTHDYETGKTFIGNGIRKLVQRALPEAVRNDDALVDAAHALMNAEYAKRYADKTKPYDGMTDVLKQLEADGIPYAVNTNKPDDMAQLVIDACFPEAHFEMILGSRDDRPRKPDPTRALMIAAKLNIPPEKLLYVGDSLVDYETAVNAGMQPVLCTWGFAGKEKLSRCKHAFVIEHPVEILKVAGL